MDSTFTKAKIGLYTIVMKSIHTFGQNDFSGFCYINPYLFHPGVVRDLRKCTVWLFELFCDRPVALDVKSKECLTCIFLRYWINQLIKRMKLNSFYCVTRVEITLCWKDFVVKLNENKKSGKKSTGHYYLIVLVMLARHTYTWKT